MNMENKELTVNGDVSPLSIGMELRKHWRATEVVSVGPAKEPEKKEKAKKDKPKKEEGKKEDAKKEEPKKKLVLKLDICDTKGKVKAAKVVSCLTGIDSVNIDINMEDKTLTVMGNVDALSIGRELRKLSPATEIIFLGPANEPKKKENPKKEKPKEEEEKKKKEIVYDWQLAIPAWVV